MVEEQLSQEELTALNCLMNDHQQAVNEEENLKAILSFLFSSVLLRETSDSSPEIYSAIETLINRIPIRVPAARTLSSGQFALTPRLTHGR